MAFGSARPDQSMARAGILTATACVCLSWALWSPVASANILYPALSVLAGTSLLHGLFTGVRISPNLRRASVAYSVFAVGWLAYALARGNPGAWHQSFVWAAMPVVWFCWIRGFSARSVPTILSTITVMTIVVSGAILIYVGGNLGLIPFTLPQSLLAGQGTGIDLGGGGVASTTIRFFGLSTLTAAGPFVLAAAIAPADDWLPRRSLLWTASAMALLASLVAGRRAIAIVMVLAPLLTLVINYFLRPAQERRFRIPRWVVGWSALWAVLIVFAGQSTLGQRATESIQGALYTYLQLGSVPTGRKSANDVIRVVQARKLVDGWWLHPLVGSGPGALLPSGFTRSDDRPWMFELQYHQTLFSVGLLGMMLLLVVVIFAGKAIREAALDHVHSPSILAATVAGSALLLANASNPYLQAIGHGWGVALPLGVANAAWALNHPAPRGAVGEPVQSVSALSGDP